MYRERLDDGDGMLFVFDDVADRSFWMKNTLIPLDMIFIGPDQTIVGVKANTTPLSLAPVSVGRPSKWVLEVAGGYAARAGMRVRQSGRAERRSVGPTATTCRGRPVLVLELP